VDAALRGPAADPTDHRLVVGTTAVDHAVHTCGSFAFQIESVAGAPPNYQSIGPSTREPLSSRSGLSARICLVHTAVECASVGVVGLYRCRELHEVVER